MGLSIVILAAGQGKRMNSALPKVLQPLAGRPLLHHVVACSKTIGADSICIVYGHGGDRVRAAFDGEPLSWALQAEQLGTGHAVIQAMPNVPDDHRVLVGPTDRLGNVEQIAELRGAGYRGPISWEVFSPEIRAVDDLGPALRASMAYINDRLKD